MTDRGSRVEMVLCVGPALVGGSLERAVIEEGVNRGFWLEHWDGSRWVAGGSTYGALSAAPPADEATITAAGAPLDPWAGYTKPTDPSSW